MKYFTQDWALLDEASANAVTAAYRRNLAALPGPAGDQAREVASAASLGDAFVNRIELVRRPAQLTLELAAWSEARGFEGIRLRYGGVRIQPDLADAARRVAESRLPRVQFDEFDRGDRDGELVHRISFWPDIFRDLEIVFTSLALELRPAPHGGWTNFGEPFSDRVIADDDS